ncbi:MAG: hypothetical protein JWP60_3745 [Ramlibacter sp.]|nr:hypothetical protein [Ramlibacter sp.]
MDASQQATNWVATEPTNTAGTWITKPVLVLLALIALLALYATYLNQVYYSRQGPFYDSMSYTTQLAKVMGTVRAQDMKAALRVAIGGQTVFFPWLEGALLALFVNPVREQSVLIQLPLVLAQALGSYYFFRRIARYPQAVCVCFAMVTVSFLAVFRVNGGLSDLRLDLSQALAFGAAVAFLSVARVTQRLRDWLIFGVILGVAFLFRATTPVYAVLLCGVAAVIDFILYRSEFKPRLARYFVGGGVALAISGWFYVVNFAYLRYYYLVWNYDANARLPLSQSVYHLRFLVSQHLGKPICLLMVFVFLTQLYSRHASRQSFRSGLNWLPMLAGLLPLCFLVLFGAALNPYVSMVAVPGALLFGLAPYAASTETVWSRRRTVSYVVAGAVAVLVAVPVAIDTHSRAASPYTPTMDGLTQLTNAIHHDLQMRNRDLVKFDVAYAGGLDSVAVVNSLVFEQGYVYDITTRSTRDGLAIMASEMRGPGLLANPIQWNALPGATGQDKIHTLAAGTLKDADYLIVPENSTHLQPGLPSTPYAFAYRDLLTSSPGVTRVVGPIRISPMESVSVYWNEHAH